MFHEHNIVHKEMRTTASIQKAWDAWVECDKIEGWFADKVTGWPGIGSKLNVTWEKFGVTVEFEIAEMDQRRKVVYKTRTPGLGTQVITVKFSRRAPLTVVNLSESGPENHKCDLVESGVESGWLMALGVLKLYLEKYYGQKRSSFMAMLPAQFTYDHLRPFQRTPRGLLEWWCNPDEWPDEVGKEFSFTLHNAEKMTGTVLAITHHEVALSWNEIEGYVEFKSFPINDDQKGLCIRGGAWNIDPERLAKVEEYCKESLVRLFAALAGPPPDQLPPVEKTGVGRRE